MGFVEPWVPFLRTDGQYFHFTGNGNKFTYQFLSFLLLDCICPEHRAFSKSLSCCCNYKFHPCMHCSWLKSESIRMRIAPQKIVWCIETLPVWHKGDSFSIAWSYAHQQQWLPFKQQLFAASWPHPVVEARHDAGINVRSWNITVNVGRIINSCVYTAAGWATEEPWYISLQGEESVQTGSGSHQPFYSVGTGVKWWEALSWPFPSI